MSKYEESRIVKFIEIESTVVVTRGWGKKGNGELLYNGYEVLIWDDNRVVDTDDGDGCKTMRIFLMPLNCLFKNG